MLMNITNKYPRTFYIVYLVMITLVIDFVMAHIFWQRLAENRQYYVRGLRCQDPYFHHSLEKNVNALWAWAGVYPVVTNSLGFRDYSNRNVRLSSDQQRIILIGDSFTEGIGPYEKTFAGMISSTMQKKGIDVLNAGVMSYSPKLYFLKMQYLLEKRKLKIDKVFVFIDVSDIQDEMFYKNYKPENRDPGKRMNDYFKQYMIRHSVIGNTLDKIISKLPARTGRPFSETSREWLGVFGKPDDAGEDLIFGIWKYEEELYSERPYWYSDKILKKWGAGGASLAEFYMDKLVKLCISNNVELVIAVYPWPQQIRENAAENGHVLFWRRFAKEHHIKFINFFPLFMKESPGKVIDRYYIPGDLHFNEAGNLVIAREFLKWFSDAYD